MHYILKTTLTIMIQNLACKMNYLQWNLCVMDTLGSKKCPGYQGVLIFQVSLYDKAPFGTITKVDYAGALVLKCPD